MKLSQLFYTIIHLKPIQIYYRLYYTSLKKLGFRNFHIVDYVPNGNKLVFEELIPSYPSYANCKFNFLNKEVDFSRNGIDWNFSGFGKLWTYNLNYFDYLQQEMISKDIGLGLIKDYYSKWKSINDGMEPYPISLRCINWIKFLSINSIGDKDLDIYLYSQYKYLIKNLEYHLLGNHLLENAFSLLWGAYYFSDKDFLRISKHLLISQLNEQILADGGHFELSPMYHQIVLFRLLDCINLVDNNVFFKENTFLRFLKAKAEIMLGWLNSITFNNGMIPLVNDSAPDIAPSSRELFAYASRLGLKFPRTQELNESGYRKYYSEKLEVLIDVGKIGPDYIPGHAHSDTFNFIVFCKNRPFIVDVGVSTYESNLKRLFERSTQAHNTVEVNKRNQSDIWSSFRVGKRANVIELIESNSNIIASHDGYSDMGIIHTREFNFQDNSFQICDKVESSKSFDCIAFFHLTPELSWTFNNDEVSTDIGRLKFKGHDSIRFDKYLMSKGFNRTIEGTVIIVDFSEKLETRITV